MRVDKDAWDVFIAVRELGAELTVEVLGNGLLGDSVVLPVCSCVFVHLPPLEHDENVFVEEVTSFLVFGVWPRRIFRIFRGAAESFLKPVEHVLQSFVEAGLRGVDHDHNGSHVLDLLHGPDDVVNQHVVAALRIV